MRATNTRWRVRTEPFLLLVGGVLLIGGFIAMVVERASITFALDDGSMRVLPVGKFTSYSNVPMHSNALALGLLPWLLAASVLGLLMLTTAVSLRVSRRG